MALQGKLLIAGNEYNVLECDYEFYQPYDNNYKPSAYVEGGLINFTLNSVNHDDNFFHDWMMNTWDPKSGEFRFPIMDKDRAPKWKNMSFKRAHCIRLSESFSELNERHMLMKITICAPIIDFGGSAKFRNKDIINDVIFD